MPPIRRTAVAAAPVAVVDSGVNFGDLGFYSGGNFTLPPGRYALELEVRMHAYTKQDGTKGQENLGVYVMAHPIDEAGGRTGETLDQFYSMGSKAKLSFMPNPETGKGVVPIPGGPASSMPPSTNWGVLLKSFYDAGLPQGIFTNDLSVMDGVWVVTTNIPEPEERRTFGAKTGDQVEPEKRQNNMISVISEILEEGRPWEGGGGIPAEEAAPAPAKKTAVKAVVKPAAAAPAVAPKTVARRAVAAPVVEEEAAEATADDVEQAAVMGTEAFIVSVPEGTAITKLALRMGTFKQVAAAAGDDMAQAVLDTYFGDDKTLNELIKQHGYKVAGLQVKAV